MDICGYHLRCFNYGNNCSDCGRQHEDKSKDYLHDLLRIWPKGKDALSSDDALEQVPCPCR
jgi:hypothetical protein